MTDAQITVVEERGEGPVVIEEDAVDLGDATTAAAVLGRMRTEHDVAGREDRWVEVDGK